MARVEVALDDLTERRLPLVSIRSGEDADGYLGHPIGLGLWERVVWGVTHRSAGRPQAQLPLTQSEFDRAILLRRAEQSGVVYAIGFGLLAVALGRFPLLLPLGLAISVLSLALHVVARFGLARLLPTVTVERGRATLAGVDGRFAARVEAGERRYT